MSKDILNEANEFYRVIAQNEEVPKAGTSEQSMSGLKGGHVPAPFHIRSIQIWIGRFPWDKIDLPSDIPIPKIAVDGKMSPATIQGIKALKWLAGEVKSPILASAVQKINDYSVTKNEDSLRDGASELFSAKSEIKSLLKDDKYEDAAIPVSYKQKINEIQISGLPTYFPVHSWFRKNKGSDVSGGDRYGGLCGPWSPPELFRTCMTPNYNHFLMWGPGCIQCGMNGSDPRMLRIKSIYPGAFSHELVKERMDNHEWHPVIPSPGFSPYIEPPPPGSPYYADPNHPRTGQEGVRFFDQQDENEYYRIRKLYDEVKAQELRNTETLNYNTQFLKQHPDKKLRAPWKSPNQWSDKFYGREIEGQVGHKH